MSEQYFLACNAGRENAGRPTAGLRAGIRLHRREHCRSRKRLAYRASFEQLGSWLLLSIQPLNYLLGTEYEYPINNFVTNDKIVANALPATLHSSLAFASSDGSVVVNESGTATATTEANGTETGQFTRTDVIKGIMDAGCILDYKFSSDTPFTYRLNYTFTLSISNYTDFAVAIVRLYNVYSSQNSDVYDHDTDIDTFGNKGAKTVTQTVSLITPVINPGIYDVFINTSHIGDAISDNATFNWSLTPQKADLSANIDSNTVFPKQAPNLRLNSVFGGEQLVVPVTVTNNGPIVANGDIDILFYLSSTPAYDPATAVPVTVGNIKDRPISLGISSSQTVKATVTIPNLSASMRGSSKYLLAVIKSDLDNTPADNTASTNAYDYLGTPSNTAVFDNTQSSNAHYFDIVKQTLLVANPFKDRKTSFSNQPTLPIVDGKHFTAAFEVVGGYDHPAPSSFAPYIVNGHATIGIGLDLVTGLGGGIKHALANDVRQFYAQQAAAGAVKYKNKNISNFSDNDVVNMLKQQVVDHTSIQAITEDDARSLYDQYYPLYEQAATRWVGQAAWNNLSDKAQIVLTDLFFNTDMSQFAKFQKDLRANTVDYVLAGFDMIDSIRTSKQIGFTRTLGDYEYMLYGYNTTLGSIA